MPNDFFFAFIDWLGTLTFFVFEDIPPFYKVVDD